MLRPLRVSLTALAAPVSVRPGLVRVHPISTDGVRGFPRRGSPVLNPDWVETSTGVVSQVSSNVLSEPLIYLFTYLLVVTRKSGTGKLTKSCLDGRVTYPSHLQKTNRVTGHEGRVGWGEGLP